MDELSAKYVKVVLKAFGPNLKKLSLARIKNLSLEDALRRAGGPSHFHRLPCELQRSGFQVGERLFPSQAQEAENHVLFGSFESSLGSEIRELTDIELPCCHIATKVTIFLFYS